MAAASDKARFYLEESVPELREWERREIFTREEITSIASKRSGFEHTLNARGSKPSDYARYAEYEMNLDTLRRKRVKRKGAKATAHTGQRRIFFILERGTRKFHGDLGLWLQYIEHARKQRANKKLTKILTDALRMHPTRPELWIYAGRYAMDVQADIGAARSYMQRGLRFCENSKQMYLEYARLEMGYVAKIAARKKILGVGFGDQATQKAIEQEHGGVDQGADMIALPTFTASEAGPDLTIGPIIEAQASKDVSSTPALSGAIPRAIFDAAITTFKPDLSIGAAFFDMFADFLDVPCTRQLLRDMVDSLSSHDQQSPSAVSCRCRLQLLGVPPDDATFPSAIRAIVKDLRSALASAQSSQRRAIAEEVLPWMLPVADDDRLGPELKQILLAVKSQLSREIPSPT